MLLLTIGQLAVGYQRFSGIEPGFDTAGLTLFAVDPGRDGHTSAQSAALLDALPDLLAALPEVRSAAVAERPPLAAVAPGAMSDVRVSTSVEAGDVQRTFHPISLEHVGGRYFETLSVPIVRGRTFTEHDFAGGGRGGCPRNPRHPSSSIRPQSSRSSAAAPRSDAAYGRTTMAEVTSWSAWSPTSGPGCST